MALSFVLSWGAETDAAGYSDVFPLTQFANEVSGEDRIHLVLGPNGGEYQAWYRLNITCAEATLDYKAFESLNERMGMYVGVYEFQFVDSSRMRLASVKWDGLRLTRDDLKIEIEDFPNAPSSNEVTEHHQLLAAIMARPEQANFRARLDLVYSGRCCISGCNIRWALDAAHISPVARNPSFASRNGLLLRRDLHALFDANHLGVHPQSRRIVLSDALKNAPDYQLFDGNTLSSPQPGYENQSPDPEALGARFSAFQESHGRSSPR